MVGNFNRVRSDFGIVLTTSLGKLRQRRRFRIYSRSNARKASP